MLTNHIESFSWPADITCTLITEKLILPNHYSIRIGVEPNNSESTDVNLGLKKVKYFVANYLNNGLIINQSNPLTELTVNLDTNIILLPCEPYDYFIAAILYNKLSAITEKYFDIGYLSLDSLIGDRVEYTIIELDSANFVMDGDLWWNKDSVDTGIGDAPSWEDLNFRDKPKFSPKIIQGGLSEG
jgi:hypothetical protein